ncbi:tripartite tricarboxylate transporter substrate binding protein [Virgibacillus sp. DJP39]|uniref:tripartite tricarboxylate transporter substrate binding protein n=1 Tax=Virgibacillus sp. DJP39 TaxID=3409790 RepID=UPI003BB814C8
MRGKENIFCNKWVILMMAVVILLLSACGGTEPSSGSNDGSEGGSAGPEGEPEAANGFPNDDIRYIMPSSAGGGFDTSSRQLQPYFEEALGTDFIMENKPGGGFAIGSTLAAKAKPDGYTIMIHGNPHLEFSYLNQEVDYTLEDFVPIGGLTIDPGMIRVQDDAPWADLDELIEYAKTQPSGTLTASVSGKTSNNYLALKQLEEATGVEFNIVPYGGGSDARKALLSGEVDFTHAGVFNSLGIDDGTRVIGVQQSTNKWKQITDNAKTFKEQGFDIPDNSSSYGLWTQAEVKEKYPERYQKLVDAFKEAVENPEYVNDLKELDEYAKIQYVSPEEYAKANKETESELKEKEGFWKGE